MTTFTPLADIPVTSSVSWFFRISEPETAGEPYFRAGDVTEIMLNLCLSRGLTSSIGPAGEPGGDRSALCTATDLPASRLCWKGCFRPC